MGRRQIGLIAVALLAGASGCTVYAVSFQGVEADGPPQAEDVPAVELLSQFGTVDRQGDFLRIAVPVRPPAPDRDAVVSGCIELGPPDPDRERLIPGALTAVADRTSEVRPVLNFDDWLPESMMLLDSATLHLATFASADAAEDAAQTCPMDGATPASVRLLVESANQTLATVGGLAVILLVLVGLGG